MESQLKKIMQSDLPQLCKINTVPTLKERRKKQSQRNQKNKRKKNNANVKSPSQQQISKLLGHYQNRQYSEAEGLALVITQQHPEHQFGWKVLGAVLDETGRHTEAVNVNLNALRLGPQDAEVHNNLGKTLQVLGRLSEAEEYLRHALELKNDFTQASNNLAITLKNLGRLEEAEATLRETIVIEPDYANAHLNLGCVLQELGRIDAAKASYIQTIELKPDYEHAHRNLASALVALGRPKEAVISYRHSIALKPGDATVHNNLGLALADLGQLDEAEASFRQAIDLKSDFVQAHNNLGNTLKQLEKWDESESSYRQAIKLQPDLLDARSNLLRCWYLLDNESAVINELDSLIKQDKTNSLIGSLTCRSKLKYGHQLPNLFCNNPLQYVSHIDLNDQYKFQEIFAQKIKSLLDQDRLSNKTQPLLVNGHQTSGNLFHLENIFIEDLEKAIRLEIENYRSNFRDSEEGLITKWPADYTLSGWLISMKSGGALAPHIHDEGWLSGSIYINVPAKSKPDSGNLVVSLGNDFDMTGSRLNVTKTINVETGSLVLFPSSLTHHTIPFDADEERIVLAFDVIKK